MKRIELTCFEQQAPSIEYILKKYKVSYNLKLAMIDDHKLIHYNVIVPDIISRNVINALSDVLDTTIKEIYLISQTLDSAISDYSDKLHEEEKLKNVKKDKKTTEEFKSLTEPSVELKKNLLFMIAIASSVALVGLFANNASLVIGAMLLSPLLGPITAFSFNAAVGQPKKMYKAAKSGLVLTLVIIAIGAGLTAIASSFIELEITPEILARTEMTPVFLVVAILLGLAGGIAMSSDIPGILVGVAIAAALVPPAVVTGISIAMLDYDMFINSLTLTVANILGLVLGTMIVFFALGITPRKYHEQEQAKKYQSYTIVVFIVMSVALGILTFWI
ncbi:TIGR00341 family protein [Nitrosarchaeum sp.]|uniref:TIGR00341 family protein n=1 Tax=Nitrosarchaeum sp. TaxID=2026886 RepID=UPI00247E5FB5|nr:TIGR00341 family protein [Nitrosarchaeum sp.]MCV0412219.1 TIGR00341 family protein [Nitrosarchaeum sp.]